MSTAKPIPAMPETADRRAFDASGDYLESDNDWCADYQEAVTWLIDNHAAIRAAVEQYNRSKQ